MTTMQSRSFFYRGLTLALLGCCLLSGAAFVSVWPLGIVHIFLAAEMAILASVVGAVFVRWSNG